MKKDRKELEGYLLRQCQRLALYAKKCEEIRNDLSIRYDIPTGMTMDMIARGKLEEQSEHVLFCLLDGIQAHISDKGTIEEYFMPVEIEKYSKTKLPKSKLKFPIVIPCIQVTDDQWITSKDTNFFMELRKAQKINYNENTQRALTKIITNDGEYYKITVEESTVSGIRSSLQQGQYIPTPITLNLPLEGNNNFYYDEEERALVINSLEFFDIIDGYHRYVAMYREKDSNPNFNCKWELRIVNFAEDRARYFIYQEDLKTKMRKIDSQAMNSYNAANRTVSMLNQDSTFSLFGQINNVGGNISAAELAKIVEAIYFKDIRAEEENKMAQKVKNELKNKFNYLIDLNEEYLTKKYTYKELLVMIYVFSKVDDLNDLDMYIRGIESRLHKINSTKLMPAREITKTLTNDLDRIFEEVK